MESVLVLMLFASCQKATFLKAETDTLRTTVSGSKGSIDIFTDGKIELVHAPQWAGVTLDEKSETLNYEIGLNTDRKLREDSIVLKSSDLMWTIYVRQSFKASYIKFVPEKVVLPREGGTIEVKVEVDAESALTIDKPNRAEINDRKIIIKRGVNPSAKAVTEIIKIGCDDITANLTITQESNACSRCGGEGFLNKPCSSCGGMGAHMCCNYTGKERCPVCRGSGLKVN